MKKRSHSFLYSITGKLIVAIVPLLLGMLFAFGFLCNRLYAASLNAEISKQLQLQLDSVASQMDVSLNEANRMGFYVYGNIELRTALNRSVTMENAFDASDRIALHNDVIKPMFLLINRPGYLTLTLYPASEAVFCDYNYVMPLSAYPSDIDLNNLIENGYAHTFYAHTQTGNTQPNDQLAIVRVLYNPKRELLGVLNTCVATSLLEAAIQSILPKEDPYYYVCSLPDGQTLFSRGDRQSNMLTFTVTGKECEYLLEFGVDASAVGKQSRKINKLLVLIGGITLGLAALLIAVISGVVMRRTRGVLKKFDVLIPGQTLMEKPLAGNDEAARLDQTFSSLYGRYREMAETRQQLLENKRLLEINLLLSRINPHFLYNTLSAIRWSVPTEERGVVDQLVSFYRGMLGKGRDVAPLSSELTLMHQYIELERFTYSKTIVYEEHVEPGTEMLLIPKFLLQPIFENAIQYCGEAQIALAFRANVQDKALTLTITNNGEPMDEAIISPLNALNDMPGDPLTRLSFDPDNPRGYGISNIIVRIRIYFGEGYGLWHERPHSGGTRARFTLPVCERIEDVQNWKKSDS